MAPSKVSQRAAARKLKDRWRSKNWYRVLAPDMFEGVQIGETLSDNPDKLMGRVLEVTLQQLTGDFSKMHIKLLFKIDTISGSDAYSNFIGHSLTSDYIRRLTRRKRSKMDGIYDVLTKDGFTIRIKPFAVTEKRIQTSQQYAIRMKMRNIIENHASDKLVSEFIRYMLSGDLSSKIFKECKPIYPIKRVEIRRSDIIGIPDKGPKMMVPESIEAIESDKKTEEEIKTEEITSPKKEPTPTVAETKIESTDQETAPPKVEESPTEIEAENVPKKVVKKTTTKKAIPKKKKVPKKDEE